MGVTELSYSRLYHCPSTVRAGFYSGVSQQGFKDLSTYFTPLRLPLENTAVFNQHCQKVKHPLVFSLKINYGGKKKKDQFRWSHLAVPYVQYKVFSSFDGELARISASCRGSWCYTRKMNSSFIKFSLICTQHSFPFIIMTFLMSFPLGKFKISATSLLHKFQYSSNCHSPKIKALQDCIFCQLAYHYLDIF